MRLNPEIQRYLWQDFSLHRTIAMPSVLLAVVLLASLIHGATVAIVGATGFYVLVFFWGGSQAANAVIEEINTSTWDNYRLSPVSPWALCFGKLFGAPLFSWYGGLMALGIYVIASLMYRPDLLPGIPVPPVEIFYNVLLMVASALLCHAVAMLTSMQTLQLRTRSSRFNSVAYLICGLVASHIFFSLRQATMLLEIGKINKIPNMSLNWFGMTIGLDNFMLCSLLLFLGWTLIGLVRTMREELKIRNVPWVWALFLLFLMVYCSGFAYGDPALWKDTRNFAKILHLLAPRNFGIAFFIALGATYAVIFTDVLSVTRYRMLCYYAGKKNWLKTGQLTPRWVVSLALALLAGLAMIATNGEDAGRTALMVIGLLLFLLRDMCILHFFLFAPNTRRAHMATMFYLAVLYGLLPGILGAMRLEHGVLFFLPYYKEDANLLNLIPALLQLGIAGALLLHRWQRMNKAVAG